MSYEQCTCSQESAAGYSQTSFSDTSQLSLWSGKNSNVTGCESEQQKDGSPDSKSGREMYGYLTQGNTKEKWIASMRDSLVKICQTQGNAPDWEKAQEAGYMGKCYVLLGKYDPNTYSLKTSQQSFIQDLNESWPTWPRWGFMQDGEVFALQKLALRTQGIDGGCWLPTPLKSDHMKFGKFKLKSVLKPTFGTHVNSIPYFMAARYGRIPSVDLLTWVMGFPNGWARVSHAATHRCHSTQQQHSSCSTDKEIAA